MTHFCQKVIRGLVRLPAARACALIAAKANALIALGLLGLVRAYQRTLSPALPVIFGPACGCRFYPTCSHYAAETLRVHGALRGTWLALIRLLKCTPLHPGGLDPVPPPRRKPTCSRVTLSTPQRAHGGPSYDCDALPIKRHAVPTFSTPLRTN